LHENNEVLKRHIHGEYSTKLRQVDPILGVLILFRNILNNHSFYELINHHKPRKSDERDGVVALKYCGSPSYDGPGASNNIFNVLEDKNEEIWLRGAPSAHKCLTELSHKTEEA
jgi:hypothetical protein